jgi:hypothetical protein
LILYQKVLLSLGVPMELNKVLEQLRHELDHIDAAIISLERLQAKESRRGRPPKTLLDLRKIRPPATRMSTDVRSAQRGRTQPS